MPTEDNISTEEVETNTEDTTLDTETQDENLDADFGLEDILDEETTETETVEETEEEEIVTEPTFFPKEENNDSDDEELLDDEVLEELDEAFGELDEEVASLKEQLSSKQTALEAAEQEALAYGNGLDTIAQHPVLGPLSDKLLKGEELNIPEILTKSIEEDIDMLPNMENIANEPTEVNTPPTLQETLSKRASQMY